ncbi:MAG: CapA family protein [Armatimonadetes bacterium]|nr:CapA family protein [Armatimonadota bacterium]
MPRFALALAVAWRLSAPSPSCAAPPGTVTIAAAGDVMLDRGVAMRIRRRGVTYPWAKVRGILTAADIAFANLECPISDTAERTPKLFCFRAKPAYAGGLAWAGIRVVSLANNHTLDCGRRGLLHTMAWLRKQGIGWCGAGATLEEALEPHVVTVRGVRVAFVAFSRFAAETSMLDSTRPTVAYASEANVRAAVGRARRLADVVVASFHWGDEYSRRPNGAQRHLAQAAVEAGADLVLGHHPHVLQPAARHAPGRTARPSLVAYSLGNFVFDARNTATVSTGVLTVTVGTAGVGAASWTPCRARKGRPEPSGKVRLLSVGAEECDL